MPPKPEVCPRYVAEIQGTRFDYRWPRIGIDMQWADIAPRRD
jgi:hypothetical protein